MDAPSSEPDFVKRNYRFNFFVNLMDGGFFWLGYSCIAPAVILPVFVSHFTDSKILIGLIGVLANAGWFFPQLFTSNWVEKVPLKKDFPFKIGFFTERLPLLFFPFTTLLVFVNPVLALFLFFLMFSWHSIGSGIVAVGWQDMIAKVIPQDRRGRFIGLSSFVGAATGILGAGLVAQTLDRFSFPYGFTFAFTLGGLAIFISWIFIAQTREAPSPGRSETVSLLQYWKSLPVILKRDINFQRFLISQGFITCGGMAWAFMAVFARQKWSLSDGHVGSFNVALLVGQAIGNLVFGYLGDRRGYKIVIVLSAFASLCTLPLALVSPVPELFYLIFGLRGLSAGGFFVASMIVLEMSVPEIRPTYIGFNNTLLGLLSMIMPMFGGVLADISGYPALMWVSMFFGLVGLLLISLVVREPRSFKI